MNFCKRRMRQKREKLKGRIKNQYRKPQNKFRFYTNDGESEQ